MEEKPFRSATILLVEDNPDDEELTLLALKHSDFRSSIVIVRDGAEAVDYLMMRGKYEHRPKIQDPRLVLLDLKLPKLGGIEVLKEIRSNTRTKYIPVVVLTTSNQDEDIIDCYRYGANSFVRKPVEFDKFTQAIHHLGLFWLTWNEIPYCY
jgi:two-component system response regulator